MSNAFQNIIVVIGFLIVALLGWYMFSENARMTLETGQNAVIAAQIQADTSEFIMTQQVLRSVVINTELLSSSNFRSLQEAVGPPPERSRGRINPFSPTL